jgi:RNA polymerase sigma-70 factor (ECF subfamily)
MTLGGNLGLLDRFVADQLPEVLRFAVRLTGNSETAEEVVQEALYRAVRSLASFRGRSQFRTWFYRIVISVFRDRLAASARHGYPAPLEDELADPRGEDPVAAAMAGELRDLIARRISALPPRQREVLVLSVYEQLAPREVAEVLGISESNVQVNLHYARARLREELAPYLSGK